MAMDSTNRKNVDISPSSVLIWTTTIVGSIATATALGILASEWLDVGGSVLGTMTLFILTYAVYAVGVIVAPAWLFGAVLPARWTRAAPDAWRWRQAFSLFRASSIGYGRSVYASLARLGGVERPFNGRTHADDVILQAMLDTAAPPVRRKALWLQAWIMASVLALPLAALVGAFTGWSWFLGSWFGPVLVSLLALAINAASFVSMWLWCRWYVDECASALTEVTRHHRLRQ